MKKVYIIFLLALSYISFSQVSTSVCYLSGGMTNGKAAGCSCNLAASSFSYFGNFCGAAVTGNSGGQVLVTTNFSIPAGCTATVQAEMKPRLSINASCTNNGPDGSDYCAITNVGGTIASQGGTLCCSTAGCGSYPSLPGSPAFVATANGFNPVGGCANGNMFVKMIVTGGVVTISGFSDRGDEITTYTINLSGTCGPGCSGVLPISLKDFYAEPLDNEVLLKWSVATEKNVAYYIIEKSNDGINFLPLNTVYSLASVSGENNLSYFNYDYSPSKGINYYRLKHVEKDGSVETHKTIAVNYKNNSASPIWINQTNETIKIGYEKMPLSKSVLIHDITGRLIKEIALKTEAPAEQEVYKSELLNGIYIMSGSDPRDGFSQKLIVQ